MPTRGLPESYLDGCRLESSRTTKELWVATVGTVRGQALSSCAVIPCTSTLEGAR